jgi:hypothetical protein
MDEMEVSDNASDSEVKTPGGIHADKVRMHLWVKRELWQGLQDIAREEDMSVSDVARNALKEHIRKQKSKIKG